MSQTQEEFDKESYFFKEIGGMNHPQNIDKGMLSDVLRNITKEDIDKFRDPKYLLHREALKSDIRHFVTCFVNQREFAIAKDEHGAQREAERQKEMKKRIISGLQSIREMETRFRSPSLGGFFSSFLEFFC